MRLSSLTTSQRRSTRPVNASLHIAEVRFDAMGLVANAGLVLPATLGERLGLPELLRQHVDLGKVAGGANPDRKALTLMPRCWRAASAWRTSTRCVLAGWVPRCWACARRLPR